MAGARKPYDILIYLMLAAQGSRKGQVNQGATLDSGNGIKGFAF
jgi:hypothetical protein